MNFSPSDIPEPSAIGDDNEDSLWEPEDSEAQALVPAALESAAPATGRPQRNRRPPNKYGMVSEGDVAILLAKVASKTSNAEPTSLAEALNGPQREQWIQAIVSEIQSLEKNGTWEPATLPPGRKAIGTKLLFKLKLNDLGAVARHKSRVVAKGFSQREGVDYNETFAPVLSYTSLRLIFAVVATYDLEFVHLDVETAFLNAKVKEEIYITLPPGLHAAGLISGLSSSTPVLRLRKSLYGIKQAPRDWHEEIDGTITSIGYKRCQSEQCIYIKISRSGLPIFICLFVDDMPCAYHKQDAAEFEADKAKLKAKYKIQELGDAKLVLGMRITRDRATRTLKVDQETYINRLLEKTDMQDCIPVTTPAEPGKHLSALPDGSESSSSEQSINPLQYGSVVGSLLYAAISTRPDISYAVGVLSRFISAPQAHHWDAAKRVLRYLKGTASLGLHYRAASSIDGAAVPLSNTSTSIIIGPIYTDANWAGDLDDRKSTSGMVAKVNGCAISWKSKKQTVVAQSSAEAEYIATAEAAKETLWLRQLASELSYPCTKGTLLLGDNETAIALAKNNILHNRTKHIDIRMCTRVSLLCARIVIQSTRTLYLQWVPNSSVSAPVSELNNAQCKEGRRMKLSEALDTMPMAPFSARASTLQFSRFCPAVNVGADSRLSRRRDVCASGKMITVQLHIALDAILDDARRMRVCSIGPRMIRRRYHAGGRSNAT